MYVEIAVVVVLTIVNGLLAMSELAVVSARSTRLKVLQDKGNRGAEIAMRLAADPGRFLSTVQIGITLVGILSGAFSGATLGLRLSGYLSELGTPPAAADALGVGIVVVAITYLSLIVGELVPKQIALRDPERVAAKVAAPMLALSHAAAPLVWLLDRSGKTVLRLFGPKGTANESVTEEEVKNVIAEAATAGILEGQEHEMISGVMRLADRAAKSLMTPRHEVETLDIASPQDVLRKHLLETSRVRLPMWEGERDAVIGVLDVKAALVELLEHGTIDARKHTRPVPAVLDGMDALDVVKAIQESSMHMALVVDEYGHFEGIITSTDILVAIAGSFKDDQDEEPALVVRDDSSYLVAGWMRADEFAARTGVPTEKDADYETVAGLVLHRLGRLPQTGERVEIGEWTLEVVDMDGRRIDKLLVMRKAVAA
ncbi:MAG: HlyC/CorC family transporter [Alphaproteobacteria bacterium]|nr:HlyC/CorC family transporter [Alphaproteobacteria bacterium]